MDDYVVVVIVIAVTVTVAVALVSSLTVGVGSQQLGKVFKKRTHGVVLY